jgi:AcrR family transcriptional regulator
MQDRAEATRRLILRSAAEQFDRKGYAAAAIAEITAQAGCTSGALYFHFGGKDQLAAAVIEEHFAHWQPLVARAEQLPAPALEQLVALSFAVMRAFRDDVVVRAGGRLWSERRAIDARLPVPFVGWIATAGRILGRAKAEGALHPHSDPERSAEVLVCSLFGVHAVSDCLDGRALVEEHLAGLWLLVLPGLRAGGDHPDHRELVERSRSGLPG